MIYKKDMPKMYSTPSLMRLDYPKLPNKYHNSGYNVRYFDIPTEFVARKAQIFAPIQGRYWEIDLYCYLDVYLSEKEIIKRPMYEGALYKHTQAYIVEHWDDRGSDGRTRYIFSYYAIVPSIKEAEHYHNFQVENGEYSYYEQFYLDKIND